MGVAFFAQYVHHARKHLFPCSQQGGLFQSGIHFSKMTRFGQAMCLLLITWPPFLSMPMIYECTALFRMYPWNRINHLWMYRPVSYSSIGQDIIRKKTSRELRCENFEKKNMGNERQQNVNILRVRSKPKTKMVLIFLAYSVLGQATCTASNSIKMVETKCKMLDQKCKRNVKEWTMS